MGLGLRRSVQAKTGMNAITGIFVPAYIMLLSAAVYPTLKAHSTSTALV